MNIFFVIQEGAEFSEHLGIMSLSSILKRAGHNVDILQGPYTKIKKRLSDTTNHAVLAYSANSFTAPYYLNINRQIKEEFNILSVFGGPYPTYCPEVINEQGVDGVCIGEGDYAFLDLVDHLTEGGPITDIPNWWIKQAGQIFRNSTRPLVKDLDSLPFIDRTLFNSSPIISIMTSRGCPYQCSFCAERSYFRRRSVNSVIAELKDAKVATNAKFVYFCDSTFNISFNWLKEFSGKYKKEIGLPFFCLVRADLVTPEVGRCLKETGCFSVGMSIETANDYLRNEILKKDLSKEDILTGAQIIKRHKIRLMTYSIIHLPFGSLDDDLETLKFNIKIKPDYAWASLLTIYKNTDIYHSLIKDPQFKEIVHAPEDTKYKLLDTYSLHRERQIQNLHKLFALTVEFTFISPFVRFLIRLPLDRLYSFLFLFWDGYCLCFRIWRGYLLGWRRFIMGLERYIKIFMKSKKNIALRWGG